MSRLSSWGGRAAMASLAFVLACAGPSFPDPEPQAPIPLDVPEIRLPELRMGQVMAPGVVRHAVALDQPVAGARGELWVYRPSTPAPPRGHPAVLIAPGGASPLTGESLGSADGPVHVAIAEAGFVVLAYALDGGGMGPSAYTAYAEAHGGLLNAVVALRYLRTQVPDVDSQRIFAAGHSAAGDVALLVAAHHPELAGVVALNAAGDGCWFHSEAVLLSLSVGLPRLAEFCQRTRAAGHLQRLRMPVFAFTSAGDAVVPPAKVKDLVRRAREVTEVELLMVEEGSHYGSMRNRGLPGAIEWMKELR